MMKKTTLILTTLIASLAIHAQEEGGQEPKRPNDPNGTHRQLPKEIVKKYDADGDGKLSQLERQAAIEARRKEMIAKFDQDGDGKLNEQERKTLKDARRKQMQARFDKDGDGTLNDEEKAAMQQAMKNHRAPHGRGEGGPRRGRRPSDGGGPTGGSESKPTPPPAH